MVKKGGNQIFLFHKLHICKWFSWFLNGLVQSIFKSIRNIDNIDDFCSKSGVKHFRGIQIVFEVCASCKDQPIYIALVISYESADGNLADLSQVVMALFNSKTSETDGRLTTLVMLLWQLNSKSVYDFFCISLESCIKSSLTVHDNKTKRRFTNQ